MKYFILGVIAGLINICLIPNSNFWSFFLGVLIGIIVVLSLEK
jgi:ammonia channel protein AmtB